MTDIRFVLGESLREAFSGSVTAGHVQDRGQHVWLVAGPTAGRTIVLSVDAEVARVASGRFVLALPAEELQDVRHIVDVIVAVRDGMANELFGYHPTEGFGYVGHEIHGEDFTYLGVDEGVEVVLRVPV